MFCWDCAKNDMMLNGLFSNIIMGFFKVQNRQKRLYLINSVGVGFFNDLVNILWEKTLLSVHKPHDGIIFAVCFFKNSFKSQLESLWLQHD